MDVVSIERSLLSPGPSGTGSRREKASGSVTATDDPGETRGSGKSERPLYPVDDTAVRISYNKEIGRIVVQVLDKRSATVLQQLPSEEVAAFLKRFRKTVALLVDITA
jgi:hypothetical protein